MPLKRGGVTAALALLLSGCGLLPLPEGRPADFSFVNTLPPGQMTPGTVAYMERNQFDYGSIPRLPYRDMTMDATLSYRGTAPRLRLQIFVSASRPDCPLAPSRRAGYGDALVCDRTGGGTLAAEVLLRPDVPTPVHLEGAELDRAARGRTLYLGVRLLEGQTTPNEVVEVQNIRARGRL